MLDVFARGLGLWRPLVALSLAVLGPLSAGAQPVPEPVDPPGRAGRVSEVIGPVWLYSPDSQEWVAAERNRPLTTGDRLATDPGGRAEVQVGSTTLRLNADTEVEVLALDDTQLALQLHSGNLTARVRDIGTAGAVSVATRDGRFDVKRSGAYRFDQADRASQLTVYGGQARYEGPNSGLSVYAGQRAEFWLDAAGVAQYLMGAPVNDEFATWSGSRDRELRGAGGIASRYVSPEMTGVDELDRYGRWDDSQEYGALWIPRSVAVGWTPYSQGRWTWVSPWGWTWVDEAPWGFAPFHYGRWVFHRNTWCWAPGGRVLRPVYAPALVAWVGGPHLNVSISLGGPSVGWFPLAPREVFVPSYRVSPRYVQNINITHVRNVTQITEVLANPQARREFANRRVPDALTMVPASVLTERRAVGPAASQWRQSPAGRERGRDEERSPVVVTAPVGPPPAARSSEGRAAPGARQDRAAEARQGSSPMMRAQPVRRGEERAIELRPETGTPAPRPEAGTPALRPEAGAPAPAAVERRAEPRSDARPVVPPRPTERAPALRPAEPRAVDGPASDSRGPDSRAQDRRGPDNRAPDARPQDARAQASRPQDARPPEPRRGARTGEVPRSPSAGSTVAPVADPARLPGRVRVEPKPAAVASPAPTPAPAPLPATERPEPRRNDARETQR